MLRLKDILMVIAAFAFGAVLGTSLAADESATTLLTGGYELPGQVLTGITGVATERPSPGDFLTEEDITVYQDRVVLDVQDVIYARFTDTNSMEPVIDDGANAIEVRPQSPSQVNEGDIVAYTNSCTDGGTVIHRVIKKGTDQLGTYFIVKGDNLAKADPCKVRFDDIKGVVVAIIY